MSNILNKTLVLVLNRNWQAINIRTLADAFCQTALSQFAVLLSCASGETACPLD